MAFNDTFIPKPPVNVPLPLLNKGMKRNVPSTVLPEGNVHLASNWNVTDKGPTRRAGTIKFVGSAVVSYAPVRDTFQLFVTAGTQRLGVVDSKFVYLKSASTLTRMNYGTSAGTIRTSGAHVIGNASTKFVTDALLAGDYISIKPGTASAQELLIESITSKSHLTLTSTPSPGPYASGAHYHAYKALAYGASSFIDHALCDTKIVIVDGVRAPVAWNGASVSAFGSLTIVPKCVTFWQDRLFFGNIIEGSSYLRSRVRWSKTTDHTSFIASPDVQWQDRPYSDGALLRLVPMGKLLIAYYEDRIDIGRPTNIAGDLLPVAFEAVDTGGSGLAGQRAVARFYDGHFVVLSDGIYYFSASSGIPQNIGEDIWKEATAGLRSLRGVRAAIDWTGDSVVFGIPNVLGNITCLWRFNYKAKAWSRDEIACTSLSSIAMLASSEGTWDVASGAWNDQTAKWDDAPADFVRYLAVGQTGTVVLLDPLMDDEHDDSAIVAVLETGDYSWQAPNDLKSVLSLSLKTDRLMETETSFTIEGSLNRGLTWKTLGTLVIPANEDEEMVNFKMLGSTVRFRITCATRVVPFTIAEIVLRVRGRGREIRFSSTD